MSDFIGIVMRPGPHPVPVWIEGQPWSCGLRGRLRLDAAKEGNYLVAGDRVRVAPTGPGQGMVVERLPRSRAFTRRAVEPTSRSARSAEQVLAANLDLLVIVQAAHLPDFSPARLDRYLLSARKSRLPVLVVINKVDGLSDDDLAEREKDLGRYVASGVEVRWTSALTGVGVDGLRERLAGLTSALVGSSGVGKSTLVNALDPALRQRTREVRAWLGKGRHTTTAAEVLPFGQGGFLIDTPGMRAFGLAGAGQDELASAFPEIAELARSCRFRDCRHGTEPHCAVRAALATGALEESRWRNYRKLARELGV